MSRSLLLKGLGGVGVIAGAGSLVVFREKIFGVGEEDLSGFNHKELIEKVGLECGLSETDTEVTETKECSVKDNGTINVEVEGKKEEGVKYSSSTSKLKVSKSEKYSGGLRFVVDSGDLNLAKDGGSSSIPKLEQFETYEVKKVKEKFYLKRKTEAKEGKKEALGLPSGCSLPGAGDSNCSLTTEEIKKVKFQGQGSGVEVSSGTVSLKISRVNDSITDFTDGYRFTFTFPGDVSINGKTLKANTPYDFKIKKGTENKLTLERAWTEDNAFAKKAGLDCTTSSQCSVPAGSQNLNVKVGDKKKEGISSVSTGKIKMEKDQPGYNQGLKFSITTGDATFTDGTGDDITKLEELETYEITEEGGKFYLSIKTSKKDAIESSLSIPEKCFKTLNTSCALDAESFKKINFDGKNGITGSGTLTISEANSTDFPLGYKFTFSTTEDATIATGNNSKIIKSKIPTDYKIKKGTGNALSLEKAWTASALGAKVGFQNCNKNECTIKDGNLNVKQGDKNDTGLSKSGGSSNAKIKVKKDQEGYNQGFKFTIEDGNINLTGSKQTDDYYKVTSLEEYETYEIKEEGNNWYLSRKDEAIVFLKKALGFEFCTGSFGSLFTCDIKDPNNLKNIKFEGKDNHRNWPTGAIDVQLAIEKDTKNNNELKFTFIDNGKSGTQLCIPTGVKSGSIDLKKNTGGVEYKIKKTGNSLSLVKKTP